MRCGRGGAGGQGAAGSEVIGDSHDFDETK